MNMTKEAFKELVSSYELAPHARLNGKGRPLPPEKQRWLNHAYAQVRAMRDTSDDPAARENLTNVLATLILVDHE